LSAAYRSLCVSLPLLHPDGQPVRIAVLGLGYVGLPLAVAFARFFPVLGFDTDAARVAAIQQGHDATRSLSTAELAAASQLRCSSRAADLAGCNVYIITVPTPLDAALQPDLAAVLAATRLVGQAMAAGAVVIYESTVYPGVTEAHCAPLLAQVSGLSFNTGFVVGYSPERVSPGDGTRRLADICKLVSGSTPAAAEFIEALYGYVVPAGIYRTGSIAVAEAAKLIENTQRDLNIALVNELAMLFSRLGLDTVEVLEAAGSKWNFQPYRPGLVGGHCISVDPYYLCHQARSVGHTPQLVLAARQVNEGMARHVAGEVLRLMARAGLAVAGAPVLVLGFAFKEACPDIRNTKVADLVRELQACGARVDIYDPWVDATEAFRQYDLRLLSQPPRPGTYAALVLAVPQPEFLHWGVAGLRALGQPGHVLYDLKSALPQGAADGRL